MQIQSYEQTVLIADDNKYLYNANTKAIGKKAYLGKNADASEWVEITTEEKEALEKEWEEESENE